MRLSYHLVDGRSGCLVIEFLLFFPYHYCSSFLFPEAASFCMCWSLYPAWLSCVHQYLPVFPVFPVFSPCISSPTDSLLPNRTLITLKKGQSSYNLSWEDGTVCKMVASVCLGFYHAAVWCSDGKRPEAIVNGCIILVYSSMYDSIG